MKSCHHVILLPTMLAILLCRQQLPSAEAFSSCSSLSRTVPRPSARQLKNRNSSQLLALLKHDETSTGVTNSNPLVAAGVALTIATTAMTTLPIPSHAYDASDYASDTVQTVITELKSASGNEQATFKAYENIAGIITEGKGVGGMVNYKGVQLDRGYVADEDTSIYNPGLTLLTESEKERLVEAVIAARKQGLQKNAWSENNEFAFDFLREKLDPFHMTELRGFLSVAPVYAGLLYLGVLGVQQFARGAFQIAYLVGVAAFFLPIVALIAAGV